MEKPLLKNLVAVGDKFEICSHSFNKGSAVYRIEKIKNKTEFVWIEGSVDFPKTITLTFNPDTYKLVKLVKFTGNYMNCRFFATLIKKE